jgi:hypothetical protein
MASNFLAGVYSNNIFSTENPTPEQQQVQQAAATDLAGSGMDVVVLASFHVHDDGSIFLNGTAVASGGQATGLLNPNLQGLLAQMQNAGILILASFGGGGSFDGHAVGELDFNAIMKLDTQYPNPGDNPFYQNLAVLFRTYPAILGLDNDLESYSGYTQYQATVDKLTQWLTRHGHVATIAPYDDSGFWTNVVNNSKDGSVNPKINWVNLQNASENLSEFVPAFQGLWSDVPAQLLAGQQIDTGTSPQQVESDFSMIAQQQSGLRGGWLWTYEAFTASASAYASAIKSGLASGTSGSAAALADLAGAGS